MACTTPGRWNGQALPEEHWRIDIWLLHFSQLQIVQSGQYQYEHHATNSASQADDHAYVGEHDRKYESCAHNKHCQYIRGRENLQLLLQRKTHVEAVDWETKTESEDQAYAGNQDMHIVCRIAIQDV